VSRPHDDPQPVAPADRPPVGVPRLNVSTSKEPAVAEVGTKLISLNAGEVYFRRGGDSHAATNVDDHRYHEVLVELKG
jgi:hypothetical protein